MEIEQLIVLLLEANIIGALMLFSFYEKKISKKNPQNPLEKLILSFEKKPRNLFVCFFLAENGRRIERRRRRAGSDAGGASRHRPAAGTARPHVAHLVQNLRGQRFVFLLFFFTEEEREREREREQ